MLTPSRRSVMKLSQIGQISIRVHDVDRAVRVLRDALGSTSCSTRLAPFLCAATCGSCRAPESNEFDHPSSRSTSASTTFTRPGRADRTRRSVRRRAAPDREDARPRAVDAFLPRSRPQPPRPDVRDQVAVPRTTGPRAAIQRHGDARQRGIGLPRGRVAPSVSTCDTTCRDDEPARFERGRARAKSVS